MSVKKSVTMQLYLQVPEHLTDKNQEELKALAFEALVMRLYALGELASGEGAKLLDLLGQYNVSFFDEEMDPRKEAQLPLSQ